VSRDEGVLKFECRFQQAASPDAALVKELVDYRNKLFELNLIGVYPDGIGFGNISIRCQSPVKRQFLISASQTGHIPVAATGDFVLVDNYSIDKNWVSCVGTQRASSESLTHAMVYETFPEAQAVIHVHTNRHWKHLQGLVPTTPADVPYGTPAMALAVQQLGKSSDLPKRKLFVMAGHEDGIMSFGDNLMQAFDTLSENLHLAKRCR
jgi:L-ribulose-5-phosphate 4-epimerase